MGSLDLSHNLPLAWVICLPFILCLICISVYTPGDLKRVRIMILRLLRRLRRGRSKDLSPNHNLALMLSSLVSEITSTPTTGEQSPLKANIPSMLMDDGQKSSKPGPNSRLD